MKKCPQCGREYDNSMSFCLDDGEELLYGPGAPVLPGEESRKSGAAGPEEPATALLGSLRIPSSVSADDEKTRVFRAEQFDRDPQSASSSLGGRAVRDKALVGVGDGRDPRSASGSSIAVLPFANMSADADNEYFCDGLAEELLNALAKISDLKVAARTSAFSFKGRNSDVAEIAQKLGVRTILEGSVRKLGDRIRITVQLVDASNGYQLWSDRFDRVIDDIFDIQDEITASVVDALKIQLLGHTAPKVRRATSNPEAYELYLKGRYNWSKMEGEALQRAVTYYRQALDIDPHYALAYAGLSDAYVLLVNHRGAPFEESIKMARSAAHKAIELDPELAEAHTSLGLINTFYDWNWELSESSLRRAIELNPNASHATQVLGIRMCLEGRFDEAKKYYQLAHELDPLSPSIAEHLGWPFYYGRDYDRAIVEFQKAAEMEPGFKNIYFRLGLAYIQEGMYDEAIEQMQTCQNMSNDRDSVGWLGYIYGLKGERGAAHALLAELEEIAKERYIPPYTFAIVYLGLGEIDEAFKWLEKAGREHDYWMIFIHVDPDLDPLRGDPRFDDLIKLVGLPKPQSMSVVR
ncbi:MAG TPA: tetratricopeptide repeat protein [Pyrinomonadaceae bacterium]